MSSTPKWAPRAAIIFFVLVILFEVRNNILGAKSDAKKPKTGGNKAIKDSCMVSPDVDLRIMPFGDSITFGFGSSFGNGYRANLYDYLTNSCDKRKVTFIGTQKSGFMDNGETEGYPGYTIGNLTEDTPGLQESLAKKPNVILLHAGTNEFTEHEHRDPRETAPERLETLIDYLLEHAPEATLIVAQIINCPLESFKDWIPIFNEEVPKIVARKADAGHKVLSVDMSKIGLPGSEDLMDDIHPSDQGYEKMAKLWYEALGAVSEKKWITA